MNSIPLDIAILLAVIVAIYLTVILLLVFTAGDNPKDLNKPNYVAWDIFAINFRSLASQGVRVLVFDVDLTLCGMHADRLPRASMQWLKELHASGFKIVLASKSNDNLPKMFEQLEGHSSWLMYLPKASKKSAGFLEALRVMAQNRGWNLDANAKWALIGDKLTDMGHDSGDIQKSTIRVLTTPQFGHDIYPWEPLAWRRTRENLTLRSMKVTRVTKRGEFEPA